MTAEDPTKNQIEEVDPEVAEILGLEDNFDLEYDEYMTLLKERIAKGAFDGKEKLSEEDLAKLANERKRIRDLKESKFTAPKKTVNTDSFFGRKKEEKEQKPITDTAKLLPGSGGAIQKYKPPEEEPQEEKKDDTSDKLKDIESFLSGTLLGIVKEIRGLTDDILSLLQKQAAADKKGSELARKESEKGGKRDKEKGLENKKDEKKASGLMQAIAKPFTSIFDTIKNFILMVLLGSAVNFLWSVFKNPMMLLKPIQGLIDGIVGFFNTVIQFIDKMVVQPVRTFIDAINSALNGMIGLLNAALKMLPGSPQIGQANIPNIPQAPVLQAPNITGQQNPPQPQPQSQQAQPKQPPAPPQPKVQLRFSGGQITPQTPVLQMNNAGSVSKPKEKKNPFDDTASKEGGIVNSKTTAFDISGLGPDRFMTALSLGEYILKPGAAEWLGGVEYLDKVNKMFGGSTVRKTANLGDIKIEAKSTGGQVGGPSPKPSSPSSSPSPKPIPSTITKPSVSRSKNGQLIVNGKIYDPEAYRKGTFSTKYIPVGNPPKSYTLRVSQNGSNFTIKQINKLVKAHWASTFSGHNDTKLGIDPSSEEGQKVLNSANVKEYLINEYKLFALNNNVSQKDIDKNLKNIQIKLDEQAVVSYWYNQAYQSHYADSIKAGIEKDKARTLASRAAVEFAISKAKGSWMPGSKHGAPEALKQQAVAVDNPADYQSTSTDTSDTSNTPSPEAPMDFTSHIIRGAPSVDSPSVQPTSPLIPSTGSSNSKNENPSETGARSNKPPVAASPGASGAPPAAAPSAPASSPGATSQPATPLIPSSGSYTRENLNKMSVDQLSKMLDPTVTGASNPSVFAASQAARMQGKESGLSGEALEKHVLIATILAKQGGSSVATPTATIAPSSITSPTQPNIPQPPQSKPTITTLPLPNVQGSGGPPSTGTVKSGSTPIVYFNSYDSSEHNIITTAAIYNIWGM
jgi:hypothetical protein